MWADNGDWNRAADIGQAYVAASAVLGGGALALVVMSLWLQRVQFRHEERAASRRASQELVKMAINRPQLAQCWGSRFAPAHVDESLFFYTNLVVQTWSHDWESGHLPEEQAREFIQTFFDSQLPRMFWERYGEWHHPTRTRTKADRFIALMNQEYLRAIKAGPPSRPYETDGGWSAANERDDGRRGSNPPDFTSVMNNRHEA
jgi:hypothetical protein